MTFNDFRRLRLSALDCTSADQLIVEEGGSVDCDDLDTLTRQFALIYNIRDFKAIRALTGLSQRAFAAEYGIPYRTLENWEQGSRGAPDYVLDLLLFAVLNATT